jgi:hypothetical protein
MAHYSHATRIIFFFRYGNSDFSIHKHYIVHKNQEVDRLAQTKGRSTCVQFYVQIVVRFRARFALKGSYSFNNLSDKKSAYPARMIISLNDLLPGPRC